MPGMDLELLSGLQRLSDDDMSGAPQWGDMGDLMGNQPQAFNYLAGLGAMMGAQPQAFNYLAGMQMSQEEEARQAMLGNLAGVNPELAMMMGWNPFSAIKDAASWVGKKALSLSPLARLTGLHNLVNRPHHPPPPPPMAQPTPMSAVQPHMPGVPDRGGRVQPLGFENGAFTAAGPAVVTVRARPQRPVRGGRLVGDFSRTGVTATGLLTLVQLVVATDGQLLSGDPISFAALSPNAFGVGVNLSPAAVGNEIFATVATSALPTGQDRIDFNLTLFGLTVG
jgi:hypothetical protein